MKDAGTGETLLGLADWPDVEVYTPERIAEFLFNNAVSEEDFQVAVEEVISMGIDPATVPHDPF